MCNEQYAPVITDIFKCLRKLRSRICESGLPLKPINLESNRNFFFLYLKLIMLNVFLARLPGPSQLMARLFVFMNGAPLNATLNARAKEAILLFCELAVWFNEKFTDTELISKISKQLLTRLEEGKFLYYIFGNHLELYYFIPLLYR